MSFCAALLFLLPVYSAVIHGANVQSYQETKACGCKVKAGLHTSQR